MFDPWTESVYFGSDKPFPFPPVLHGLLIHPDSRMIPQLNTTSKMAIPALSAGFTSGLGLLVAQVAFGSFIFSGPLAPYTSQGVGLILFGNFAACLVIALLGGYRGAIAGLSPALVIGMAVIGSSLDAEGPALFVTTCIALMICAVTTGVFCLAIGRFELASLMRFIPYPVAGGFVAGIGGAVCLAALSRMGAEPDWLALPALFHQDVLWKWVPGAAFGVVLYLSMKRWGNPLILPVSVLLAVVGYHFALNALGISGEEARTAGLLLKSTAEGSLWPAIWPADVLDVSWASMTSQIPNMLALMLVAFISIIMNIAGLEMATNQELDWDREFRVTGLASMIAGLGGGTVATLVVPASLRSKLFGATTRMTGVVAALVIGAALVLGDGMLEVVPAALVGGILVFAGLGMLDEGLVRSRRRLPWLEYGIVLMMFLVVTSLGLIEGVAVGMLATLVFFAVRLSRVDPIESRFTARERESMKTRSIPDRAILREEGVRIQAFTLRGYLFFGSAYALADEFKNTMKGASRPVCMMLDFAAVSGLDFSAVNALGRFLQAANSAGVRVVLSAMSEGLEARFEQSLPAPVYRGLLVEPDSDRGLERCEDILIEAWNTESAGTGERRGSLLEHSAEDLQRYLDQQIDFENLLESLQGWMSPCAYADGEVMSGTGAATDHLQLILSGRASGYDKRGARLFQCGPGDALWPKGAPNRKAHRVVADEPCRTMLLSPAALDRLEQNEQRLTLDLYRYLLAGRLRSEQEAGASRTDPHKENNDDEG